MTTYLKPELKPLYAQLLRLDNFKKYLISNNFDYFCIEKNLDGPWEGAMQTVRRSSSVGIIAPGYTGYATEALEIFMSNIHSNDKAGFILLIGEILNDFQNWKKGKIEFKIFSELFSNRLNYSKKDIESFEFLANYEPVNVPISSNNDSEGTSMIKIKEKIESRKIFIVHGHDNGLKQHVARTLEKLDLEPVILHEQPDSGQTIIEKFENNANDVQFAIVLMTPDDEGKKKGEEDLKTRARQNVILEFGFFVGKYGRQRVICLNSGVKDIPSDIHGLIYISVDDKEAWKFEIAKNLKAAGYEIDSNKLF